MKRGRIFRCIFVTYNAKQDTHYLDVFSWLLNFLLFYLATVLRDTVSNRIYIRQCYVADDIFIPVSALKSLECMCQYTHSVYLNAVAMATREVSASPRHICVLCNDSVFAAIVTIYVSVYEYVYISHVFV